MSTLPRRGLPRNPSPNSIPPNYCGEADFVFSNGIGLKVSTTETFDFTGEAEHWGITYDPIDNIYTMTSSSEEGVYCYDESVEIPDDVGTPGSPHALTILSEEAVTIPGNPFLTAAHADSILIMAAGDVKINGNPTGGNENFEGLIYAGRRRPPRRSSRIPRSPGVAGPGPRRRRGSAPVRRSPG